MPLYNYNCANCEKKAAKVKGSSLTYDEMLELSVFETRHSMSPSETELAEATLCPRCRSKKTSKVFMGMEVSGYVRGKGFADVAGRRRDLNLFKMTTTDENGNSNDPYKQYREPGEADDLVHRLKKGGTQNTKTVRFIGGSKPKPKSRSKKPSK